MAKNNTPKAPSQRQLRVGEEIRHVLSEIFRNGDLYEAQLMNVSITVSEVRISPDLRNATAYVMPLGGQGPQDFLTLLNASAPQISHLVSKRIKMKFTPRLSFRMDNSFDVAFEIEQLIDKVKSENDED